MASGRLILSSGDPTVDRRIDWARALMEEGSAADAAALLTEAVARAGHYAPGWFLLGEAREAAGDTAGARAAFEEALALDAADTLGATLRLARLEGEVAGMSAAYVRALFDQYADRFDAALARLDYRGPEVIEEALARACEGLARPFAFARGLDLGCGTGLVGVRLVDRIGTMEGVDLSPNMVAQARRRKIYDALVAGEMVAWLRERPAREVDLLFAGDAFCYLDDLAPILAESRRVLEPGGLLAFTTETHDGEGVLLRDTLRFAHAQDYVRAMLAAAGLALLAFTDEWARKERDQPVPGLVVVAMRER
ncbi:methyltransferase domain-containing protein [Ancylobacter dichloromethanicus]|uniref:Methyltransferase n=1 Tax=Ancylobacter dichloromethanicus TaxID=518825 RepID=A0A9W6J8G7_9HYPH|nr:methyltransferase domain-containing protein [Ancylobacter dichloromethanicus]MBS7555068.1 methyltransferase domain-containing protein [Ancylobacter dichloromethanicus]GLK72277.1 methyltransferase [Ancylobacter dichloromethanicus]